MCLACGIRALTLGSASSQHHLWHSRFVDCAGCWIHLDDDDSPWTEQKALLESLLNSFLLADMLVDARTGFEVEAEMQDPEDPSITLAHTTLGVRPPLPPPRICTCSQRRSERKMESLGSRKKHVEGCRDAESQGNPCSDSFVMLVSTCMRHHRVLPCKHDEGAR